MTCEKGVIDVGDDLIVRSLIWCAADGGPLPNLLNIYLHTSMTVLMHMALMTWRHTCR